MPPSAIVRRRSHRRRIGLVAAVVCSILATQCTSDPPSDAPRTGDGPQPVETPAPPAEGLRFGLFGDSLASETVPFLEELASHDGDKLVFSGFPGTAICDFLPAMNSIANEQPLDAVVLLFTGNSLTQCIVDRTGVRRGIVIESGPVDVDRFVAAYRADAVSAITTFGPDMPLVVVGVPLTRGTPFPAARALDALYRTLADEYDNVHYLPVDPMLTPGGEYHDRLPCLPDEPCERGEMVPVRAVDGGHLCPPAPTFCFGGRRMAVMVEDAVRAVVNAS